MGERQAPGVTDFGGTRVGSGHSRDDAWTSEFRRLWLPLWPPASDDLLEGVYRQSRTSALGRRYVEAWIAQVKARGSVEAAPFASA
ncbi:hypothetical protein ACFUEJ_10635 [Gordonia sp. NPDC057258]|uniref:hypothetical protein n=1 Tax=unclassified Gordonia (in: high G+C Gram-positive bacteria) TaxID=2657482 RepID=UPI003630E20A